MQLLLILLGVIGPMILATGMYKLQFWVPEGRSYHGELIGNGQTRADIGVQAQEAALADTGDRAQGLRGGLPATGVSGAANPDRPRPRCVPRQPCIGRRADR